MNRYRLKPRRQPWTRDEIVKAFARFHRREGRWPNWYDLRTKHELPSGDVVNNFFVKIEDARLAAGKQPRRPPPQRKLITRAGYLPVDPIRRAIRRHMVEDGIPLTRVGELVWNSSPKTALRRIKAVMEEQHMISFDLADRILCAMHKQHLWRDDPVLAEHYERVVEESGRCSICGEWHPVGRKAAA